MKPAVSSSREETIRGAAVLAEVMVRAILAVAAAEGPAPGRLRSLIVEVLAAGLAPDAASRSRQPAVSQQVLAPRLGRQERER